MRDRQLHERDMVVAWDGSALPEMIGGAIVGALIGLVLATVPPGVMNVIPDVAGVVAGALAGAVLSYVWRPRRITAERQREVIPEEQAIRSRAA
jgi:ABC-type enterobactin transport system permease subunit